MKGGGKVTPAAARSPGRGMQGRLAHARTHTCARFAFHRGGEGASGCCSRKNDKIWGEISRWSEGKIRYIEGVSRCHFVT